MSSPNPTIEELEERLNAIKMKMTALAHNHKEDMKAKLLGPDAINQAKQCQDSFDKMIMDYRAYAEMCFDDLKHRNKKTCQMCGADTKHSNVFCSSMCRISQQQEDDMEFY